MAYVPHTPDDIRSMLDTIGVGSVDELFASPCLDKEGAVARLARCISDDILHGVEVIRIFGHLLRSSAFGERAIPTRFHQLPPVSSVSS